MAEEEGKGKESKEEVVAIVKKISRIELEELTRLNTMADQAPNRVIGTINLQEEAQKNLLDYHKALADKYQYHPYKIGINRMTGDLQMLPQELLDINEKSRKHEEDAFQKLAKELSKRPKKVNKAIKQIEKEVEDKNE